MAGPGDEITAAEGRGRGGLRASHADREQVIGSLKAAFVQGRLTKDELDMRVDRVYASRTYAELAEVTADLAALTADIPAVPSAPAVAGLARPPTPARRWPLARAAAKSGGCLVLAFALVLFAANVLDPHGLGNPYHPWSSLCALVALGLVLTALGIFATGAAASVEQRRSRRRCRPGRARAATPWKPDSPAAPAMARLCPQTAPTRPAPTCGLTAHGRAGRILPGGAPGSRAAYGRYRTPGNRPLRPSAHRRRAASRHLPIKITVARLLP